jgi:hypothetical protein
MAVKPPIGIQPKYIWKSKRIVDLSFAIERYRVANLPIPIEWVEEYNELLREVSE